MCCFPLQVVIADFGDAVSKCDDSDAIRQLNLVMDGLRLSASLLRWVLRSWAPSSTPQHQTQFDLSSCSPFSRYPWMFTFELTGRLLPLVADNEEIKNLLLGCDLQGHEFNCFLPACHCFHSPGGPLKYSMEVSKLKVL